MSDRNELVEVRFERVVKTTGSAALLEIDGEEHWIPFSQIAGEEPEEGDEDGVIEIPRWLVDDRGIDA